MNAIKLKGGLSIAFIGVLFGLVVLAGIRVVIASMDGTDIQLIPDLVFNEDPTAFVGDYLEYFFDPKGGLGMVVATLLFYIGGTYFIGKSAPEPGGTDKVEYDTAAWMRGLLIGLTSGTNFVLAYNIYGHWFGSPTERSTVGLVIAVVLFALGVLTSLKAVSQNEGYQGVIGWLCWLAPMSWPVLFLGLILGLINIVLGLIFGSLFGVDFMKVRGDKTDPNVDGSVQGKWRTVDWKTGTFFLIGGLVGNANPMKTAFDMGNIGFIYHKAKDDYRDHEAGHNLSLFAFGWIFHFIGALDQLRGTEALAEQLANSNDSGSSEPQLEMWA